MKVSANWLKQLVDFKGSIDELSHTLTMAGLEVEEMSPVAPPYNKIVVAEVKTVNPHPNADKLRVTEVDVGTGSLLQIVCGAPNVAAGMRVPCALVGAKLPGIEIKEAKLRGVDSNGMLCSARELGLSEDHGGLLALPADAPIGQDIREYLDLNDVYLTLKLTPNRGDCLSMVGIARDLAAVTGAKLNVPTITPVASTSTDARAIKISTPKACGQYLGRVIKNINTQAPTPDWMKRRLERSGFRSISPLVDITNYLTLERGRPMHAFDLDKLKGGINVRYPNVGEEMNLLNEQHVVLKPDMLLITDDAGPVAMGGVMGGLESSVTATTTNVFFEAAFFAQDVIQGKTRFLGINSDAAYRFERGVDPTSQRDGIEYATRLTLDICGTPTTEIGPITEATGELPLRVPVRVRVARVNSIIGMNIESATMMEILTRLQCRVASEDGAFLVTPPAYRFDLNIEEDFIEEIARVYGYEKVPVVPPKSSVPMLSIPEGQRSRKAIRHVLADLGYQEVINYSFVPETWEADFAANLSPVKLANPIASHMSVMRTSLIGGLIETLKNNLNRGESRLRLFELGRCFLSADASFAAQPERMAGLAYGPLHTEQWGQDKTTKTDFFAIKGDIEALLQNFHISFEKIDHPALHPGRSASILVNGKRAGLMGELHPRWQQKYDLPNAPILFELDIEAVTNTAAPRFSALSRMQAVRRDIALLFSDDTPVQAIIDAVKSRKYPTITDFSLFDLYRGNGLAVGQKSLAFRIVMQDTELTLTDSECDSTVSEIVKALSQEFGATLRK
jgi:phenylalanyl-tRNA synthetase beta chain